MYTYYVAQDGESEREALYSWRICLEETFARTEITPRVIPNSLQDNKQNARSKATDLTVKTKWVLLVNLRVARFGKGRVLLAFAYFICCLN